MIPSNVDDHLSQPAIGLLLDPQAVIGDRFDFMTQLMARAVERFAPGRGLHTVAFDVYLELAEKRVPGVKLIKEAVQPIEEKQRTFVIFNLELTPVAAFDSVQVFDNGCEQRFGRFTEANINNRLAVVLDSQIFSVATIQNKIEDSGRITNIGDQTQVSDLALTLTSGSLPAGILYLEERTVGPSLGADSIHDGLMAGVVGVGLVVLVMLVYYKRSGINAVLALLPKLADGQWHDLGAAAKALKDAGLLAKSAPATKLFRKHPQAFQLQPEKQPNQVRFGHG